jgi:hypothetical protein
MPESDARQADAVGILAQGLIHRNSAFLPSASRTQSGFYAVFDRNFLK